MEFWKMNGAGNDFIILNNIQEGLPAEAFPCSGPHPVHPHRSLGADGFMVVEPAQGEGDFRMGFYNSDGSMGEMCGNGARCICRYGYENGLAGDVQRVETTAGLVTGRRISRREYQVRLNDPTTISPPGGTGGRGENLALRLCGAGQPRSAPRGGALSRPGRGGPPGPVPPGPGPGNHPGSPRGPT